MTSARVAAILVLCLAVSLQLGALYERRRGLSARDAPPPPRAAAQAPRAGDAASVRLLLQKTASLVTSQLLPRAHTPRCRATIQAFANELDAGNSSHVAFRHPIAEVHCAIDTIAASKDVNQWAFHPRSIGYVAPRLAAGGDDQATIAFVLQMPNSPNFAQLRRLLTRLLAPRHVYLFCVDARPDEEESTARTVAKLGALVAQIAQAREIMVRWWGTDATVDVVYTGPGLMDAQIASWRRLLREDVPHWDTVINLTPSDYPMKTTTWMAKYLAHHGAISWTESFLQNTDYGNGRKLHEVVLACPDEPCGEHPPTAAPVKVQRAARRKSAALEARQINDGDGATPCHGFVFHAEGARKPPLGPSREFGGSAFSALHRSYVESTTKCLAPLLGESAEQEVDADSAAYCESVRSMYRYYASTFCPEELFVQTVLFNGPFCRDTPNKGGNLRWVAWDAEDQRQERDRQNTNDITTKRPGFITVQYAHKFFFPKTPVCKGACLDEYMPLFARKFHANRHPDVFAVLDDAAEAWQKTTIFE